VRVAPHAVEVATTVRTQLTHGRYAPSTLYGDGYVSSRIAEALTWLTPYVQKRLHYIHDNISSTHVGHTSPVESMVSLSLRTNGGAGK